MTPLILTSSNDYANAFGFGTLISSLIEGLNDINAPYTLNENNFFDVIIANDHFNGYKGIELKKKTGKPLIASIHLCQSHLQEENELIKNCDGIITYSKKQKNWIIEYYKPNVPVGVIYYGININRWKCLNQPREPFVIFSGRASALAKGFMPLLMQCLNENVKLKVAGDITGIIWGIECKYMNKEELEIEYNKAQLHILPSLIEPFGLVTLEAMLCGCPVAVSINSGVAEILNGEVAIFFDPFSKYSIKEFIERAKTFDSNKIRQHVEKFNHINYAKNFLNEINNIIS
jgi:glycosyltransferase involved in cell wall biosynthesis